MFIYCWRNTNRPFGRVSKSAHDNYEFLEAAARFFFMISDTIFGTRDIRSASFLVRIRINTGETEIQLL